METVTLPVKGLNFAGCAREIEKHLGKLEPIAHVEASYVSQTVMNVLVSLGVLVAYFK
jgi:copper chaperone CopZ